MEQTHEHKNVDQQEIAKFDTIAYRWWDTESEFKPLHDINPLRLGYITKYANISGIKVLDVGCGGGILSESMAKAGAKVTGIDLGEGPIDVAKLHLYESELDIEYIQIPVEELAEQRAGEYDVVTCMEMLEHVPDPGSIIRSCAQLVKPGGDVFFSTINRNPKSYLYSIIGAEYLLKMLPKGTHDYRKMLKPSELSHWIREAGLNLDDLSGMTYNPISKQYSINKDIDVNYLCHCTREA
jgi:2-polyprenyl-6-hydroxyphenyl methylase/3-demethylubiquinone-9 3-methyltransferase